MKKEGWITLYHCGIGTVEGLLVILITLKRGIVGSKSNHNNAPGPVTKKENNKTNLCIIFTIL